MEEDISSQGAIVSSLRSDPIDSAPLELKAGDIIQIGPDHKWRFCLAMVDEVRAWGVQAFVRVPRNDGMTPGDAYIRLSTGEFEPVGAHAIWGPAPESNTPSNPPVGDGR